MRVPFPAAITIAKGALTIHSQFKEELEVTILASRPQAF
jgi:hypothetical protein